MTIPATAYKPTGNRVRYDADYTQWKSGPARTVLSRRMATHGSKRGRTNSDSSYNPTRSRSCRMAYSPPGSLVRLEIGYASTVRIPGSLLHDFSVRCSPEGRHIFSRLINRLPAVIWPPSAGSARLRVLASTASPMLMPTSGATSTADEFTADQWASGRHRANRP